MFLEVDPAVEARQLSMLQVGQILPINQILPVQQIVEPIKEPVIEAIAPVVQPVRPLQTTLLTNTQIISSVLQFMQQDTCKNYIHL